MRLFTAADVVNRMVWPTPDKAAASMFAIDIRQNGVERKVPKAMQLPDRVSTNRTPVH